MTVKLVIDIDCPPGSPRPGDVARYVGMKWGSSRYTKGKVNGEFDNTSRLFGNWVFVKPYEDEAQARKDGEAYFEKLRAYYPGTVRYGAWAIE